MTNSSHAAGLYMQIPRWPLRLLSLGRARPVLVELRVIDGALAVGTPGGNLWTELGWWERLLFRYHPARR